ncbi:MAG: beta-lactamase family protein [Cyclobacteriaceae bacterium]
MRIRFFILCLITTSLLNAQGFNSVKLDSLFDLIEENNKGMGSLSIYQNGKPIYAKAIGYKDLEADLKADTASKYRIGSITKIFTSTLIMQLIEDEKLTLSTSLDSYFPNVENADKITIKMLLGHRSGIFNFTSSPDYIQWMESPVTKIQLIERLENFESVFIPNEKTEYSNSNYLLLTFILEEITGKSFADLIADKICNPAGLTSTYYGGKINPDNNEVRSYTRSREWKLGTETDMTVPRGAGAIVSTPSDLNKFLNALFTPDKLITTASLEKMKTIQDGMGLGMFQVPFYDKRGYGHNGGIDGFQTSAFYFPEEKASFSYFSNGVVMIPNEILIGILSIYFGMDYQIPSFEIVEVSDDLLESYSGNYTSPDLPMDIVVTRTDVSLSAQATGQPAFPLEAMGDHQFKFSAAGLEMHFNINDGSMKLLQAGQTYIYQKQ